VKASVTTVGGRVLVEDGRLSLPALSDQLRTHDRISREMQGLLV
jgi:hypothetical protein